MIELKIFKTQDDIADYIFRLFEQITSGEETGTAALSFGSTYDGIFRRWKENYESETKSSGQPGLPAFFPADERLVDINHPGSNWGAVKKSFLNHCGTDNDRNRWASDASAYRRMLSEEFGKKKRIFDIILLGVGPDGHTASLFPGDCPQPDEPAWNDEVMETIAPFDPPQRLTLGPDLISSAKQLIITVTGSGKAEIFKRLMNETAGSSKESLLPPALIIKRRQELGLKTEILCDEDATEQLDNKILDKYKVKT